jgi:hypothetical protein
MPGLRRLITALLLLFWVVPLGSPLGIVLCFGADGHVAFEPVHDRAQGTASLADSGLFPRHVNLTRTGAEHPNPCVDVTFFTSGDNGQYIPASDICPKPETPLCGSVLLMVPLPIGLPASSILPERPFPNHYPLTILRSVVLHL